MQLSASRRSLRVGLAATTLLVLFASGPAAATEFSPENSALLHWILFLGVLGAIWLLFYKVFYPYFLRYFQPAFSEQLFWSLFGLYALAWMHLSLYLVFDFGFQYSWIKWAAAVIGSLWLPWLLVLMMRRRA